MKADKVYIVLRRDQRDLLDKLVHPYLPPEDLARGKELLDYANERFEEADERLNSV